MHVTEPRVFELPQPVQTAFLNADIALFETDYRRSASRKELRQYIDLPKGQSLEDIVGRSTYRDLLKLIHRHRLPLYNFFREQPWVAWMALSDRDIPMGREEDAEKPVLDDWLALRARKAGRDVGFLETSLEQWQSFAAIPMDDQIAMLRSAIQTYYTRRFRLHKAACYCHGTP